MEASVRLAIDRQGLGRWEAEVKAKQERTARHGRAVADAEEAAATAVTQQQAEHSEAALTSARAALKVVLEEPDPICLTHEPSDQEDMQMFFQVGWPLLCKLKPR